MVLLQFQKTRYLTLVYGNMLPSFTYTYIKKNLVIIVHQETCYQSVSQSLIGSGLQASERKQELCQRTHELIVKKNG